MSILIFKCAIIPFITSSEIAFKHIFHARACRQIEKSLSNYNPGELKTHPIGCSPASALTHAQILALQFNFVPNSFGRLSNKLTQMLDMRLVEMTIWTNHIPANTKHLYNICTTSVQRLRRWSDIVNMLYKCFVFAGMTYIWVSRNPATSSETRFCCSLWQLFGRPLLVLLFMGLSISVHV